MPLTIFRVAVRLFREFLSILHTKALYCEAVFTNYIPAAVFCEAVYFPLITSPLKIV